MIDYKIETSKSGAKIMIHLHSTYEDEVNNIQYYMMTLTFNHVFNDYLGYIIVIMVNHSE